MANIHDNQYSVHIKNIMGRRDAPLRSVYVLHKRGLWVLDNAPLFLANAIKGMDTQQNTFSYFGVIWSKYQWNRRACNIGQYAEDVTSNLNPSTASATAVQHHGRPISLTLARGSDEMERSFRCDVWPNYKNRCTNPLRRHDHVEGTISPDTKLQSPSFRVSSPRGSYGSCYHYPVCHPRRLDRTPPVCGRRPVVHQRRGTVR